jgi:TPR repeat protein
VANELLSQEAKQGNPVSQYLLGLQYFIGEDVPQDYAEAATWFQRAAGQGIRAAQEQLGDMYALGQGVPKDLVRAHMWLNLAGARKRLGGVEEESRRKRDELARQMTPAQIAEAQRLAREWEPKPEQ